jgi:hypothetical protein
VQELKEKIPLLKEGDSEFACFLTNDIKKSSSMPGLV